MSYKIRRIVGVKNDVEVVKLSCDRSTSSTKEAYTQKLLDFYDRHGVKLDFIEVEGHYVKRGEGGGRPPIVSLEDLDVFIRANPYMSQKEIAVHFGMSGTSMSRKIGKLRGQLNNRIYE